MNFPATYSSPTPEPSVGGAAIRGAGFESWRPGPHTDGDDVPSVLNHPEQWFSPVPPPQAEGG